MLKISFKEKAPMRSSSGSDQSVERYDVRKLEEAKRAILDGDTDTALALIDECIGSENAEMDEE